MAAWQECHNGLEADGLQRKLGGGDCKAFRMQGSAAGVMLEVHLCRQMLIDAAG